MRSYLCKFNKYSTKRGGHIQKLTEVMERSDTKFNVDLKIRGLTLLKVLIVLTLITEYALLHLIQKDWNI